MLDHQLAQSAGQANGGAMNWIGDIAVEEIAAAMRENVSAGLIAKHHRHHDNVAGFMG